MKSEITIITVFGIIITTLFGCRQFNMSSKQDRLSNNILGEVNLVPLDFDIYGAGHVDFVQWDNIPNLDITYGRKEPFMVPEGVVNVALNKPVMSSSKNPLTGKIEMIVDGIRDPRHRPYRGFADVELEAGIQYVTIDLRDEYYIYAVVFWHCYMMNPVYYDIIVQVADSQDFTENVETLFNNDHDNSIGFGIGTDKNYIEGPWGKIVGAKGIKAKYVKLYSNGNWGNELNHYVEVEVYGKPVVE